MSLTNNKQTHKLTSNSNNSLKSNKKGKINKLNSFRNRTYSNPKIKII